MSSIAFGQLAQVAFIAAAASSMMGTLLYGVRPQDPSVFVEVSIVLFTVAILASYLPARRAVRVDPNIALRQA